MIYEANSNKASLYSIFFDMENAFPRVWTHLIISILHQTGLSGPLPILIQSFLQDRVFQVRVGGHLSNTSPQENEIPQGSPISGTLFIPAIINITSIIPFPLRTILLADDLSIHFQSSNHERARRRLQETISLINEWLSRHGFRISLFKTHHIIFHRLHCKLPNIPTPLSCNGITLPTLDTTKFLGLHFSSNHSWLTHIKHIKAKALRTINILEYISHPSIGCNRKI